MKSFEEFRQEQHQEIEELEEAWPLLGLGTAAKWLGGKAIGEAIWGAVKGTAKGGGNGVRNTAGRAVSEGGKPGKKAWDCGDKEVSAVKGRDEKGLPKSS